MKKIFLVMMCLTIKSLVFAQAENNADAYAQESQEVATESKADEMQGIKGFYNIPFGSSKKYCIDYMKSKGWKTTGKPQQVLKSGAEIIAFVNGTYAGEKLKMFDSVYLYFDNDYFYLARLNFYLSDDNWDLSKRQDWIKNIEKTTVYKYNLTKTSDNGNSRIYTQENNNIFKFEKSRVTSRSTNYDFYFIDGIYNLMHNLIQDSKEKKQLLDTGDL